MIKTSIGLMVAGLVAGAAWGATVHVVQQTDLGGTIATFGETLTVEAGSTQTSVTAPTKSGYIFTHWSISDGNTIEARDALGRANEIVSYVAYDDNSTLTAHYLPMAQDSDGDGVADGSELYWYGDLGNGAASDTDGDGFDFAAELAAGTSPLLYDFTIEGGVLMEGGDEILYNPKKLSPYIVRCDPEGTLFETTTNYVNVGVTVALPVYSRSSSVFAYWSINGVRQTDALGRSEDNVSFAMPNYTVECVAKCETDSFAREQLYWYGTAEVDAGSDTDGDGFTLAQEIAAGTNPRLYDYTLDGGVLKSETALTLYNAKLQSPYIIRSDPSGKLVETSTNYVIVGTAVTLPTISDGTFAYWSIDGVAQRDEVGRAFESSSFKMPNHTVDCVVVSIADSTERSKLYWYGRTDVEMDDDTDGDGFTLAQEIAAGTNPHLYDFTIDGGVLTAMTVSRELDLQKYEQVQGALVDKEYEQLFTSPLTGNAAASRTFADGSQIWPVVADVNGDGLWDLIVCSATTTNVFVNTGTKGNPQFEERGGFIEAALPWCDMNSTEKLAGMTLDVAPVGALSATTNGATMLVSDEEGRIWYYSSTAIAGNREQSTGVSSTAIDSNRLQSTAIESYTLAHKVWGGSYAGFASGLRLAAVDWEDDGDLDCLCGTAEGKLMLLRDPKVGRPTGLTAAAGVDNVKLEWEPNGQSRVRGYRVYRGAVDGYREQSSAIDSTAIESNRLLSTAIDYSLRASTALPRYRDEGLAPATYAYKVSALSRFYTAGNSTPTETESIATEPVSATVGGVTLSWGEPVWRLNCDTAGKVVSSNVIVNLIINNSLNYDATGLLVSNVYDTAKWRFLKVETTGLSEKLAWEVVDANVSFASNENEQSVSDAFGTNASTGVVTLKVTGGEVAAGGGVFFTFVFEDLSGEEKVLMGDIDGDGDVDVADLRLLGKLKGKLGRRPTARQIKAGDFNGNNGLDDDDYQALRQLLIERGEL